MDVRDLRIGSKIKTSRIYGGRIMTFDRFNEEKDIVFFSDGSKHGIGEFFEDCEPIPLTEKILLACGFEKRKHHYADRYVLGGFEIEKQGSFFAYVLWCEDAPQLTQYVGHCKHLHELQNLYKLLEKKELEFKSELV